MSSPRGVGGTHLQQVLGVGDPRSSPPSRRKAPRRRTRSRGRCRRSPAERCRRSCHGSDHEPELVRGHLALELAEREPLGVDDVLGLRVGRERGRGADVDDQRLAGQRRRRRARGGAPRHPGREHRARGYERRAIARQQAAAHDRDHRSVSPAGLAGRGEGCGPRSRSAPSRFRSGSRRTRRHVGRPQHDPDAKTRSRGEDQSHGREMLVVLGRNRGRRATAQRVGERPHQAPDRRRRSGSSPAARTSRDPTITPSARRGGRGRRRLGRLADPEPDRDRHIRACALARASYRREPSVERRPLAGRAGQRDGVQEPLRARRRSAPAAAPGWSGATNGRARARAARRRGAARHASSSGRSGTISPLARSPSRASANRSTPRTKIGFA